MNQDFFSQSEGKMKIVEGIVGRVEEWLELYPWHSSRPLRELPPEIRKIFTDMAKYLLDNLNTQGLVVELIPAPEPKFDSHKIRVVRESNPDWYRDLYGSNSHIRRDRSKLSLERLHKEKDLSYHSYGHNDTIYRQLIFKMLVNGCLIKDVDFEPNKEVRKYFGLEVTLDNDDSTTCRDDIDCDDDEHEYDNIEEVFITRKLEFCDDEPYEDVPF